MLKKILIFLFLISSFSFLFSKNMNISSRIIDTPNGNFYNPKTYTLDFMLYKNGGLLNWFELGVFRGFNLGISLDLYRFIGDEDAKTRIPQLTTKVRLYRGDLYLPCFYVGYSGQGYGDKVSDNNWGKYENPEKGIFFAMEREFFIPELIFNFGINMYDFEEKDLYGFINARYFISNKLLLLLEYDNIHSTPENKLNFGIKYFFKNNLSAGIGFKNLKNSSDGDTVDRVLMLSYSTSL